MRLSRDCYQVVFVNDEYFARWSAADCFCEFTYLAIGCYHCADAATLQDTVGGRVLCRESIDHKHHLAAYKGTLAVASRAQYGEPRCPRALHVWQGC